MSKFKPVGQFNRRVTAQKLVITQNDSGGTVEEWAFAYDTWAYVGPVSSYRQLQQLQNVQVNSYEIQMRHTPSKEVSKNMRFLYEGQILIVNSIEQITEGRKRFWSVVVMEQV